MIYLFPRNFQSVLANNGIAQGGSRDLGAGDQTGPEFAAGIREGEGSEYRSLTTPLDI